MVDLWHIWIYLGATGVAASAAASGCWLVWQRLSFFGDCLAHAAFLGGVLALILKLPLSLGIFVTAAMLSFALGLSQRLQQGMLLLVLSYISLAMGVLLMMSSSLVRVDPMTLMFGDILTINEHDVVILFLVLGASLGFYYLYWRKLLLMTVDDDLALSDGVNPKTLRIKLLLMLSIVTCVCMQIVGALLFPALLIIPAAAVVPVSKSPLSMIVLSVGFAVAAMLIGITLAFWLSTPLGPTVVAINGVGFFLLRLLKH